MKLIRSLLRYAALILIIGGVAVMSVTYITKKEILTALVSNTIVKSSMSVIKTLGMCVGAVIAGLLLLLLAMKLSSSIRRIEREKTAELRAREKENKETNKRLQKEAEEAKKEAEQAKKEAERMKESLKTSEEENKE
ncbi:MAG: hypothetical protein IKX97_05330 [Erysipelotrichaceae bacterium]|nr:hypothetical protein [Erysipelotrichaceae bacterium]